MNLFLSIVTFIYLSMEPVRKFTMSFIKYIFRINNSVIPQTKFIIIIFISFLCLIIKTLSRSIFLECVTNQICMKNFFQLSMYFNSRLIKTNYLLCQKREWLIRLELIEPNTDITHFSKIMLYIF